MFKSWVTLTVNDTTFHQFEINGEIFRSEGNIFLLPKGSKDTVIYFSFSMEVGMKKMIRYLYEKDQVKNRLKKYLLVLEDKFNYPKLVDTIYKFRFENFGSKFEDDDLVIFLSPNLGPLGFYEGDLIQSENGEWEEIYSFYGEIFREKYFGKYKMINIPDSHR